MSTSDGLGSSIFCRKMENARPMMKEMDEKGCSFPARVSISDFDVLMYEKLFPICTLTWRVNDYISRQEKV